MQPKHLLLILTALILIFSCTKPSSEDPIEPEPQQPITLFESDSSKLTFSDAANEIDSFHVTSTLDWVITIQPIGTSWIKVSTQPGLGTVKVLVNTTEANKTGNSRTATITVISKNNPPKLLVIEIVQTAELPPPPPVSSVIWSKLFGGLNDDEGWSLLATPDGGQITVGSCMYGGGNLEAVHGSRDGFIMKTDASGNRIWTKVLGSKYADNLNSVINSNDGGYIAAGVNDGENFGGTAEASSAWIVKVDANGNVIWERFFRSAGRSIAFSITATPGGGYAFADTTGGSMWVVKIDELGNEIWQNRLRSPFIERAYNILANPSGGYVISGESEQGTMGTSGHHGGTDARVASIDENGNLLWSKYIGGTGNDWFWDAKLVADGLLFCGSSNSSDGDITGNDGAQTSKALVMKMDQSGNMLWLKLFGGQYDETGYCLAVAPDNNSYILGGAARMPIPNVGHRDGYDTWMLKIDPGGKEQAKQFFGGSRMDIPYSVIAHQDGTFTFTGYSESNDGHLSSNNGKTDVWLLKSKFP